MYSGVTRRRFLKAFGVAAPALPAALLPFGASAGDRVGSTSENAKEANSLLSFGAHISSARNDDAILKAALSDKPIYIPDGVFATGLPTANLPSLMYGPGQVKDLDGKRGRYFSWLKGKPENYGGSDSIVTAFDGDIRTVQFPLEHRVTGDALGTPATGYEQHPETAAIMQYFFVDSGHNEESTAGGRTGFAGNDGRLGHYGQGDAFFYTLSAIAAGAKAGASDFLANPAIGFFNGSLSAASDGIYFNPVEWNLHDNGRRTAAAAVINLFRSVDDNTFGEMWFGWRVTGTGPASGDVAYSAAGFLKRGLDTSAALLGDEKAAVTLAQGQRIYFASLPSGKVAWSQATGDEWLGYNMEMDAIVFSGKGAPVLAIKGTEGAESSFQIVAGMKGGSPRLETAGKANNVGLKLVPKGHAVVSIPLINVPDFKSDTEARRGGVEIGGLYRQGSALMIRTT